MLKHQHAHDEARPLSSQCHRQAVICTVWTSPQPKSPRQERTTILNGLLLEQHRWLLAIVSLPMLVSLVAMNYHFVSEVIAGSVLGGIVGAFVALLSGVRGGMEMPRELLASSPLGSQN